MSTTSKITKDHNNRSTSAQSAVPQGTVDYKVWNSRQPAVGSAIATICELCGVCFVDTQ